MLNDACCWACAGFSRAYDERSNSADSYIIRHRQREDEVAATDVTLRLDGDRGRLQQSASVVTGNDDASAPSQQHVQQLTQAGARSPGI